MIEKIRNSALAKSRKFSLAKKQNNNPLKKLTLPAKKELETDVYESSKINKKFSNTKCSAGEYEFVDYCSPLFP